MFFAIHELVHEPHPLMMAPFAAMLLAIAFLPMMMKHHWERHFHQIALVLGAITTGYYVIVLRDPGPVARELGDYISFIAVVGSLFMVSGGIHLEVRGGAKPWTNCVFLLIGVVLCTVIGTTGASMLLIRPWIRMNRYRYTGLHTAFFIFLVSNVGGALTPLGPPLLLGFLEGIPFFWWVKHACKAWLIAVGLLLGIFYLIDRANFVRAPRRVREAETATGTWRIRGLSNIWFLLVILVAIFVDHPRFLRECLMIAAAAGSYFTTSKKVHEANDFSFAPAQEVAWLFLGIFVTMTPVLGYMQLHARELGIEDGLNFYWLTGSLSSVLDNAPTFLTFLANALGRYQLRIDDAEQVRQFSQAHSRELLAISLGASFFGAGTYIGNGPNFMVRSITQHAGVKTPSFFGYIVKFALPLLVPVLYVVSLLAL